VVLNENGTFNTSSRVPGVAAVSGTATAGPPGVTVVDGSMGAALGIGAGTSRPNPRSAAAIGWQAFLGMCVILLKARIYDADYTNSVPGFVREATSKRCLR
jgi:hypothetical protein